MEGPVPRIKTPGGGAGLVRCVGFAPADTSPSSVLRDGSPASSRGEPPVSPLSAELLRASALRHAASERHLPALPKLKLGKPKGMPRSKSQGNLQPVAALDVPPQTRSATSSPHAASSAGSEPVRIE